MRSFPRLVVFTSCLVALAGCAEAVHFDPNRTAASFVQGGESGGSVASRPAPVASSVPAEPAMSFSESETTDPAAPAPVASAPVAAAPAPVRASSTPTPVAAASAAAAPAAAPVASAAPAPSGLSPASSVRCSHRQRVTLSNVAIDGRGRGGIEASGECHVTITSCTIASDRVAVSAAGDSQIELVDCVISGERGAVAASGTSVVRLTRGSVSGSARATGRATIEHDGASIAQ